MWNCIYESSIIYIYIYIYIYIPTGKKNRHVQFRSVHLQTKTPLGRICVLTDTFNRWRETRDTVYNSSVKYVQNVNEEDKKQSQRGLEKRIDNFSSNRVAHRRTGSRFKKGMPWSKFKTTTNFRVTRRRSIEKRSCLLFLPFCSQDTGGNVTCRPWLKLYCQCVSFQINTTHNLVHVYRIFVVAKCPSRIRDYL